MKYLFLILIFLTTCLQAQVTKVKGKNAAGTFSELAINADGSINAVSVDSTIIITGSSNLFSTGFAATASATVADTLTFGFSSNSITIINDGVTTDTLFVSPTASFAASGTIALLGGETQTIAYTTATLYVKGGANYEISRKYRITAN